MCFIARVKLAVNEVTNTAVAVKIIRLNNDKQRNADIRKEVTTEITIFKGEYFGLCVSV